MPSMSLDAARKQYPGKTDAEIAAALAAEGNYVIVVQYKLSSGGPYTHLGLCSTYAEADDSYLLDERLYGTDVIFDCRQAGPPPKRINDERATRRSITFSDDGSASEPCCWSCRHFSQSLSGTRLCCRDALGRGVVQVDKSDLCEYWTKR